MSILVFVCILLPVYWLGLFLPFLTACESCSGYSRLGSHSPGISLETTLSKIDEANDDIIGNANLNKLKMIDNIDEATDEILKNLDLLRDGNKEWFQKLANNQKVQVLNQITLLRRQKKSNIMLSE